MVIAYLPELKQLDNTPIIEEERRRSDAWRRGGSDEVKAEQERIFRDNEIKKQNRTGYLSNMLKNKDTLLQEIQAKREREERGDVEVATPINTDNHGLQFTHHEEHHPRTNQLEIEAEAKKAHSEGREFGEHNLHPTNHEDDNSNPDPFGVIKEGFER